jgi:glycosyltransferase involved in cell wall biosynthesis
MSSPLASIVITNYNYGRFLDQSITSALHQRYADIEVIVVDDGSSDDSRARIAAHGDRIVSVLKENGGQNSAVNAGFAASRGQIVVFLDADDWLLPSAVEQAARALSDSGVVQAHWPLGEVSEDGNRTGQIRPRHELAEGDLRAVVMRDGPDSYITAPMSGNAWSRPFLERVLPIPPLADPSWADAYFFGLAPLFGLVKRISDPQGCYRLHGKNNYASTAFEKRVAEDLVRYNARCDIVARHCRALGITVDAEGWKERSWLHRLDQAVRDIDSVVPPGSTFLLADEDEWATGGFVCGRRCLMFPERDGRYWGRPANDDEAIQELNQVKDAGIAFVVFAWPAFWWLDHYAGLDKHLREAGRVVFENDRVKVFALEQSSAPRSSDRRPLNTASLSSAASPPGRT